MPICVCSCHRVGSAAHTGHYLVPKQLQQERVALQPVKVKLGLHDPMRPRVPSDKRKKKRRGEISERSSIFSSEKQKMGATTINFFTRKRKEESLFVHIEKSAKANFFATEKKDDDDIGCAKARE